MSDENPYSTPNRENPLASGAAPWHTDGTTIYVSDGAVLPAIDLDTGEASEDLIEVRRKFSVAKTTLGLWGVLVCLVNLLPTEWKHAFDTNNDNFGILIGAFLTLLAAHLVVVCWRPKLLGKCVRFRTFETPRTQKKAQRARLVFLLWTFFSVSCCIVPALIYAKTRGMTGQMNLVHGGMIAGGASLFASIAWLSSRVSKIRFKGFSGKWLRVTGACDEALAHLRKIESERLIQPAA